LSVRKRYYLDIQCSYSRGWVENEDDSGIEMTVGERQRLKISTHAQLHVCILFNRSTTELNSLEITLWVH